jgi:PTS system mannitol-specific IIA component/PTS system ascorbate-specific IIA component
MLGAFLKEHITLKDCVTDWKEAIGIAAQPLLEEGAIQESYLAAMIQNVIVNGSYIVIVPGFAMPHARPEMGVLKNGLSFLGLKEPVLFPEEKEVRIMIVLAACDAEWHLDLMGELSEVLMDDGVMEQLFHADSKEAVLNILK